MGPAYFPTALGGILVVLGAVVFLRAFVSKVAHPLHVFPFRFWYVLAGLALGCRVLHATYARCDHGVADRPRSSGRTCRRLMFAAFGERSLWVILFSVVVFGYALKPLGLVMATGLLVFISAWGGHEFRWKEVTIMAAVLAAFSVASFVYGLGLPMNVWPSIWE